MLKTNSLFQWNEKKNIARGEDNRPTPCSQKRTCKGFSRFNLPRAALDIKTTTKHTKTFCGGQKGEPKVTEPG